MRDRRTSLRIKRSIDSVVYAGTREYRAEVIDISEWGIAFEVDKDADIAVGDSIDITIYDEYTYIKTNKEFAGSVTGEVRNTNILPNGKMRCGCLISDKNYTTYVQEQYIMAACGVYA